MSLQDKLDGVKKEFEAGAPPEALTVMHRATEDLLNSGIMEQIMKAGEKAPDFTLPNQQGKMVGSSELLRKGPLVLSFYRGVW
jgi:hypothetical protein